jgi:hypothetical protein
MSSKMFVRRLGAFAAGVIICSAAINVATAAPTNPVAIGSPSGYLMIVTTDPDSGDYIQLSHDSVNTWAENYRIYAKDVSPALFSQWGACIRQWLQQTRSQTLFINWKGTFSLYGILGVTAFQLMAN